MSAALTITQPQLRDALLVWEHAARTGQTRTHAETLALPVTQVADENVAPLWASLLALSAPAAAISAANSLPPALPAIGRPWPGIPGSCYAGIATAEGDEPDGHIVLLRDRPTGQLAWADAVAWGDALGDGAHVPTRTEAALLYANLRDSLDRAWHWTSSPYESDDGSSYAWYCDFYGGNQYYDYRSAKCCAVAVRRFAARSFDPSAAAQ